MIERLERDIVARPDVFFWSGPVPREEVLDAVRRAGYAVPDALVDLWEKYGVLDMFETETILSPTDHGYDGLVENNEGLRQQGMPPDYIVFHTGLFMTAVRQSDQAIVQLDEDTFAEEGVYDSLKDWYERGIRGAYATHYRLQPAPQQTGDGEA